MSGNISRSCDVASERSHLGVRIGALLALCLTALSVLWVGETVYRVVDDSWVAPLHLSPDNDKVLHLRVQLERHLGELARVEAEVGRIDAELEAIDAAVERLSSVRSNPDASMAWSADVRGAEQKTLARGIANLREQRRLLERLYERQRELTDAAGADLEAGLIDRATLQAQRQAQDSLALSLAENRRDLDAALLQREQAAAERDAYRRGIDSAPRAAARMPEVAAGEERRARLDVELIRLESERRSLRAMRSVADERLTSERGLLEELRARPLYRAMKGDTDIAFVPYDQLEGAPAGARVLACTWSLFRCKDVGRVAEVLPGEVVSEDPWGDLARGQYAILAIDGDSAEAIRETLLRIRR